jgi:hypothetical protein
MIAKRVVLNKLSRLVFSHPVALYRNLNHLSHVVDRDYTRSVAPKVRSEANESVFPAIGKKNPSFFVFTHFYLSGKKLPVSAQR